MLRSDFESYYKSRDYAAISDYKVDNAIILAAECFPNFAPLTDTTPKPLLKVKGEILIERLIRQLIEADISNIYVVVGYKKEMFYYLANKFGVHIVENPEYMNRNNHSSIYAVREHLANSYICSADTYFKQSVFSPYEFAPYYSAAFAEGKTTKYCLQTNFNNRINGIKIGGNNTWYACEPCYWDKKFSRRFVEILEAEYDHVSIYQMQWKHIYMNHLDKLTLYIKKQPDGVVRTFDTLDELCLFDTSYIPYRNALTSADATSGS